MGDRNQTNTGSPRPEILAPAGNAQMLSAAVLSGADAVYLGLTGYNARRSAGNFTPEELEQAVAFCHARGVRVHVTLNTLVFGSELAGLADAVRAVARAGADAVIADDLAVAALVRQIAPGLALHGSTQMTVHTPEGVRQLAAMGYERAILARELSLEEIRAIASASPIEVEVFIHGAMCMAVSGQCMMSAFLGGRSGNRGLCAGPCRLPFSAAQPPREGDFHLSLKDHSHLASLPALREAGIASVKIEGRLRGPEYVAAAVAACVAAREGLPYDEEILRNVFSRSGFTDGYIKGVRDGTMFGVRTAQDSAAARAAAPALRELYRRERPSVPVSMRLTLKENSAALEARDGQGHVACAQVQAVHAPAQKNLTQSCARALEKTGGTPFFVREAAVQGADAWYAPAGEIGALRREALEKLLALRAAPPQRQCLAPPAPPLAAALQPGAPRNVTPQAALCARFETPQQLACAEGEWKALERVLLPVQHWASVPEPLRAKTWLELPRAEFTGESQLQSLAASLSGKGFAGFVAQNLAHFALPCAGPWMGGFGLNVTNAAAARAYLAMGCESVTASPELTARGVHELAAQAPTAVLAYGHMPLMLTRACPLHNVHGCKGCPQKGTLTDRKGAKFPVRCTGPQGMRTVYNPVPLYLCDKAGQAGADMLLLYFTIEPPQRVGQVLRLARAGAPFDGAFTRGLFFKGVL